MKKIAITGLGAITPLGFNVTETWSNLLKGQSGIDSIQTFDTTDFPSTIAGAVRNLERQTLLNASEFKRMDRFVVMATLAADEALRDAGLLDGENNLLKQDEDLSAHAGVCIGSGLGGGQSVYEWGTVCAQQGPRRVSPFFVSYCLISAAAGTVSARYHLRGPNQSAVTACAAGSHAISWAASMIESGRAKLMIAGGTESTLCPIGVAGFSALRGLSTRFNDTPQKASRPWDENRDGFVIAEGSGLLVLEDLEHAQKRGAKIYAILSGYGASGDAYHITGPEPQGDGAYRSMKQALHYACLTPEDIDYIHAHGTSTPQGDAVELMAVERLFLPRERPLYMSSTKGATGHTLGASGGIESIFSVLALRDQIAPATLNLDSPPQTDVRLIAHGAKPLQLRHILKNSFGFGGTNASLVFSHPDTI